MRRLRFIAALFLFVAMVATALGGLYALLRHEPRFYRAALAAPGGQRVEESRTFEQRAFTLLDQIVNDPEWREEFSDRQVNSWLAEDFLKHPELSDQWVEEFRSPRVEFLPGRMLVAYRSGGRLGPVISVDAKVWLSSAEPNTVVIEIQRLRAGALPVSLKVLQDRLSENARDLNMDVQWYRNNGNATALVRFQADKREPTFQLQALEFRDGSFYVKGRSLDPGFPPPSKTAMAK